MEKAQNMAIYPAVTQLELTEASSIPHHTSFFSYQFVFLTAKTLPKIGKKAPNKNALKLILLTKKGNSFKKG